MTKFFVEHIFLAILIDNRGEEVDKGKEVTKTKSEKEEREREQKEKREEDEKEKKKEEMEKEILEFWKEELLDSGNFWIPTWGM